MTSNPCKTTSNKKAYQIIKSHVLLTIVKNSKYVVYCDGRERVKKNVNMFISETVRQNNMLNLARNCWTAGT